MSAGHARPGPHERGQGSSSDVRKEHPEAGRQPSRFYSDGRFWLTQVAVALIWLARLTADLMLGHGLAPQTPEFTTVGLFLVPVLYATLEFELDGGLATVSWVALLTVPRAVDFAHKASPVGVWADIMQVLVLLVLAAIVGRRVTAEHQATLRAESARQAHLDAEARYRQLFASNAAPILLVDGDGMVMEANWAAEEIFARPTPNQPEPPDGIDRRRCIGQSLAGLIGPEAAQHVWAAARASAGEQGHGSPYPAHRVEKPSSSTRELAATQPPGSPQRDGHTVAPLNVTDVIRLDAPDAPLLFRPRATLLGAPGAELLQVVLQDVTAETNRQEWMEAFAGSVLQAQEDERRRIAQELHDGPLQGLVYLCRQIDQTEAPPELRETAQDLVTELRDLARGLRPSVLDDLGLVASIKHLLGELESRSAISTSFGVAGEPTRLAPGVELALFRVTQEALSNVERHAGASHVAVGLSFDRRGTRLLVSDDGAGFDAAASPRPVRPGSLGMTGMHERIALVGGSLQLHSEPGSGTTVDAWVPIGSPLTHQPLGHPG